MNISRYTVQVDAHNGEHLLYNTATGAFAVLDDSAFQRFLAGEDAAGLLTPAGFLTQLTPQDELAAQQALFARSCADTSSFALCIAPTYACNYRCPYCYEQGHNQIKGIMGPEVQDRIYEFVESTYERDGFTRFEVQWYGGDPSLALDVVEAMSQRFMAWCAERGVEYDALMLTNACLIDEDAAKLLADCRVTTVLLTLDGPEEYHNKRRVAADGSNSYQRNIQAARHLRAQGISIKAICNVDRITMPLYPQFAADMWEQEGIEVNPGKLNDYAHTYGTPPFAKPDFDLYTHEEFAWLNHAQFRERLEPGPQAAALLREMLRPVCRFCRGQLENYAVVDVRGDVYKCDGWIGEQDRIRFNLADDPDTWNLSAPSFDATRDPRCSSCELLPVCQGSCSWERELSDWPCHPLKHTLSEYLLDWRSCYAEVEFEGGVALLAEPMAAEEILARG